MSDNFQIRAANVGDAHGVIALISEIFAEYGIHFDLDGPDSDLADIEKYYLHKKGSFYVVDGNDGLIVATVALNHRSDKICEIKRMYLAKELRGRGYGKELLEFAIAQASERGYERIILETAGSLKEAVALYERYGFQPYDSTDYEHVGDLAFYLDL